nr:protein DETOXIFICATION 12-like isoform X2 [Ipomoea batatas]
MGGGLGGGEEVRVFGRANGGCDFVTVFFTGYLSYDGWALDGYWCVYVVECDYPRFVHEVLYGLHQNALATVMGNFSWSERVLQIRYTICCHDLSRFELLVLLSGLLPNPQFEASVLSVCLNPVSTLYAIPYRLTSAVCTRVSNELGAGNPEGARLLVVSVMFIAVAETVVVSATLFACRHVFGYVYSNKKVVVDYVADMTPLLCLSVITDSLEGTLSGVARGCGWQHIGAYINIASFCLCGISISASFWLNLRGKGLWIGIVSGATL